jgi:hypothetical protein
MGDNRGLQVKADLNKEGWESAEFPILCETCLGDNPYVRCEGTYVAGAHDAQPAGRVFIVLCLFWCIAG